MELKQFGTRGESLIVVDYDVIGHELVSRVCIKEEIKKGDIFNVYFYGSKKIGAEYDGKSIISSIESALICEESK